MRRKVKSRDIQAQIMRCALVMLMEAPKEKRLRYEFPRGCGTQDIRDVYQALPTVDTWYLEARELIKEAAALLKTPTKGEVDA